MKLLVERMNEQVKSRRMYYAKELHSIEEAFIKERQELLEKYNREWSGKLDERRFKEVKKIHRHRKTFFFSLQIFQEEFVRARFERHEKFERDLNRLRIKQAEEFNATKVKLETQIQDQQKKIEEMKATYQLSQEKYEYNCKVLKKRDEENGLTINVQKNRKIKLNDLLTHLKQKLVENEKKHRMESIQAAEEYKRTLANIQEIKRKAKCVDFNLRIQMNFFLFFLRHFLIADMEKFHELWIMNEERCKEMAQKLLDADRIIFEQQLGLEWMPNDLLFMDNVGPIDTKRIPKPSIDVVREILTQQEEINDENDENSMANRLSNDTMKSMLGLLCDEGVRKCKFFCSVVSNSEIRTFLET